MAYVETGLREAIKLAESSTAPHFKLGAVLIDKRKILSRGRNFYKKSHTQSKTIFNGIHAEFHCLRGLEPRVTKGMDMIVVRVTLGGKLANSRPCEACMALLKEYGIKRVWYSTSDQEIVCERVS